MGYVVAIDYLVVYSQCDFWWCDMRIMRGGSCALLLRMMYDV
jgi:hypothetical protein